MYISLFACLNQKLKIKIYLYAICISYYILKITLSLKVFKTKLWFVAGNPSFILPISYVNRVCQKCM